MIVKSRKYWRRRERGQIYVLMSLGIVALLGMAGLGADIGVIYGTRRQMQTAADAAAIAAANALQGSSTVAAGYQTAANDAASINGFTNATNGVTITTTEVSCPGAASEQCVQVNIAQAVPTYFLRALGKSSISLDTVAIAGGVNAPGCIYALDPSASEAVSFTGNVNITASCGLIDDSSNSQRALRHRQWHDPDYFCGCRRQLQFGVIGEHAFYADSYHRYRAGARPARFAVTAVGAYL